MKRQRIPNALRALSRPGTRPYVERHTTLAAGIHDERFSLEVKQRIEARDRAPLFAWMLSPDHNLINQPTNQSITPLAPEADHSNLD